MGAPTLQCGHGAFRSCMGQPILFCWIFVGIFSGLEADTGTSNETSSTNTSSDITSRTITTSTFSTTSSSSQSTTSGTSTTTSTTTETTTTRTTQTTTRRDDWLFCQQQVVDAVKAGQESEITRFQIIGENLECKTAMRFYRSNGRGGQELYNELILQLALRYRQQGVAYALVRTYTNETTQLYARNATLATPLMMAADQGFTEVVFEMLRRDVNAKAFDATRNNAFHLGAVYPETTVALVENVHFSDLDKVLTFANSQGDMPVHVALKGNQPASATKMINEAFSRAGSVVARDIVRATDMNGSTPAHLNGDADLFQILVARGADLRVRNDAGAMPLHTTAAFNGTAENGALAIVAAAVPAVLGSLDVKDYAGRTALHYACEKGHAKNVAWLVEQGADPSIRDNAGEVPLTIALREGYWQLVWSFSVVAGSPLQSVVLLGRFDVLKLLVINESLPANMTDPTTGRTAIFAAAETGRVDILRFFLSQGLDVNSMDNAHLSVLSAGVRARQPAAVEYLLNHGAPARQRLQNASTALHVAAMVGGAVEAELLLRKGKAKVDAVDYLGRTPLHFSASAEVTVTLLQAGAKVLRTVELGLTPLHTAAYAGRASVLAALMMARHGEVDARSANGDTPLHSAALGGDGSSVKTLLQWCADAQALNNNGQLPSEYAATSNMAALIRDATMAKDRCQCDCGAYQPGPLFGSFGWKGGCVATVRCRLDRFEASSEPVRCMVYNGTPGWEPASPSLACSMLTSRSGPPCRPRIVLLTLLVTFLLILPQRIHCIGLLRPNGVARLSR